jgi:hypothetical protein
VRDKQNAVLDALQRTQRFLDENSALLTGVDLTAARKRLDDVVTSFSGHAFDQDVGGRVAKGETAKQHALRLKLRVEQMEPIAIIARHNLRSTPEFKALQMPKPSVRGQAFIASAKGMADAATVHKDTLVGHGLQPTFIDDLKAGAAKLDSSMSDREKNRTQRVGATKGLLVEEQNGRTVLSVLDALVQQALGGENEALLRKWQSVRLVRRSTANTSTTPATTPQSTPAATSQPTPATAASTPTGGTTESTTSAPVSESAPVATA